MLVFLAFPIFVIFELSKIIYAAENNDPLPAAFLYRA